MAINLIHGNALMSIGRYTEAGLTGENLAFTHVAGGVPDVRNSRAVHALVGAGAASTTEVDILHGVDASPGIAFGEPVRDIADSLPRRARQGLGPPVAASELVYVGLRTLLGDTPRVRRRAGRSGGVAALVVVVPRARWAGRSGRSARSGGDTALEVIVPLELFGAALVRGRRWGV